MDVNEIRAQLDKLSEYQSQLDVLNLEKQKLIDAVLTPEIKKELADIEAEFSNKSGIAAMNRSDLELIIKTAVKELGASVKGAFLHAVYVKGRVSWDAKSLDGFAVAHPEILYARKEGEPSVSLRSVQGG